MLKDRQLINKKAEEQYPTPGRKKRDSPAFTKKTPYSDSGLIPVIKTIQGK
jgi:hypothetical protein